MACEGLGITADILNDCAKMPVAGVEANVTLFNRGDIASITYSTNKHIVEGITLKSTKRAYLHTGFKKSINGGHEAVADPNMPNYFKHSISFESWGIDGDTIKALDNLADVVAIVEMKNKAGDGTFQVYGLETGLYATTDTRKFNDVMAKRLVSLESLDPSTVSWHNFYLTSYDVTSGLVDALQTPAS